LFREFVHHDICYGSAGYSEEEDEIAHKMMMWVQAS